MHGIKCTTLSKIPLTPRSTESTNRSNAKKPNANEKETPALLSAERYSIVKLLENNNTEYMYCKVYNNDQVQSCDITALMPVAILKHV